jgi:hypothetical protein
MKCTVPICLLSLGVAVACGGTANAPTDGGTMDSAGASSGGSGSGSTGGSGSGGGSGAASGSSGSGGRNGGSGSGSGAGPVNGDCPNCPGSQICCLAQANGQVQGTCAATASACPSGASAIPCAAASDCSTNQMCCVSGGNANSPASTSCQSACPAGSQPACGGAASDNVDCPGVATNWICQAIPGTPSAVVGRCVPAPDAGGSPMDGGQGGADTGVDGGGPQGGGDGGAPDGDSGPTPQDASTSG